MDESSYLEQLAEADRVRDEKARSAEAKRRQERDYWDSLNAAWLPLTGTREWAGGKNGFGTPPRTGALSEEEWTTQGPSAVMELAKILSESSLVESVKRVRERIVRYLDSDQDQYEYGGVCVGPVEDLRERLRSVAACATVLSLAIGGKPEPDIASACQKVSASRFTPDAWDDLRGEVNGTTHDSSTAPIAKTSQTKASKTSEHIPMSTPEPVRGELGNEGDTNRLRPASHLDPLYDIKVDQLLRTVDDLLFWLDCPDPDAVARVEWFDKMADQVGTRFDSLIKSPSPRVDSILSVESLCEIRAQAMGFINIIHSNPEIRLKDWGDHFPDNLSKLRNFVRRLRTLKSQLDHESRSDQLDLKPTREDQSKSQFVDTDLPLIPARGKFAASIERLLDDLVRYAEDHPEFQGSVFRDTVDAPIFALRYLSQEEIDSEIIECSPKDPVAWQEYHDNQNNGVRALDSIAGRIMRLLSPFGVVFPEGTSKGASVMAWALSDSFYSPCGKYAWGKVKSGYRPFESVREKLLETLESVDHENILKGKSIKELGFMQDDAIGEPNGTPKSSADMSSGMSSEMFQAKDCDDDLWLQLNILIEAMEKHPGEEWAPI